MNRSEIRDIVKKATKIRLQQKIKLNESFCILDLAEKFGLEVRFVNLESLEGAYFKDNKTIFLSTYRPEGRIRFTCAHEFGHFVYKHSDQLDELVENNGSKIIKTKEKLCDLFASFLLMPETTVRSYFIAQKWNIQNPSAVEIFIASSWLGVGYTTLLNHLCYGLRKIDRSIFNNLIKIQPKDIKKMICGFPLTANLLVIDESWNGRPLDMQVGDHLFSKNGITIENDILKSVDSPKAHVYKADKPGITRITLPTSNNGFMIRIRKKDYTGRSIFRHLGED